MENISEFVNTLPNKLKNNYLMRIDNSIQEFNKNEYKLGFYLMIKAFFFNPFETIKRYKDFGYHIKKILVYGKDSN